MVQTLLQARFLNTVFPSVLLPLSHVADLDLDLELFTGVEDREGGVVSSCLPHFLPSTPVLIGNLGGPVYLHG